MVYKYLHFVLLRDHIYKKNQWILMMGRKKRSQGKQKRTCN